jgi:hypothetical protein
MIPRLFRNNTYDESNAYDRRAVSAWFDNDEIDAIEEGFLLGYLSE